MTSKERSLKDPFESIDYSMSQYYDEVNQDIASPQALFDDILTIEERYQQSRVINQGGMKKILKTTDALTNRPVAKATLIDFEDSDKVESFLREARLTAALEHPNIIPVYDLGVDDTEGPYFIMKLVGGENLASILKSLSASESDLEYSLQDLMEIFLRICDAVAYAHSKGIIHLDLKPENIQIGDYGEVLVCDWGLSKVLEDPENIFDFEADLDPCFYNDVTLDGYIKGSPGYMAPEQANPDLGSKDQKTDIYALGGILYSLLTFSSPMDGKDVETIIKDTLAGNIIPPSIRSSNKFIPPSLEAVAMKALERAPDKRYESVSDLRKEIYKWIGGFATEAEKASFAKSLWLLLKRHKIVSSLLLIIFISAIFAVSEIKKNEQRAVLNEQRAVFNEKKSQQSLALYERERDLTGVISHHAMKQLPVIYNNYKKNSEYAKALKLLDETLQFQPNNEMLYAMKGEAHFYRQEYSEAYNSLEKSGEYIKQEPYKTMFWLSPKYVELKENNEYIKADDFASLLLSFEIKIRLKLFNFEGKKFRANDNLPFKKIMANLPRLKNHLELCRIMTLKGDRAKAPLGNLNFKYSLDEQGIILDLSHSNKLEFISYIRHLPLKSLNLESTKFWQQWVFTHYYLQSINIKNSIIFEIKDLSRLSHLKEIILTKEQYERSHILRTVKSRINFMIE